MWARFRMWKNLVAPMLVAVGSLLLTRAPEQSAAWFVAIGMVVLVGLAYLFEEAVRDARGGGRPCATCGQRVRMRSFRVQNTCPGCGQQL